MINLKVDKVYYRYGEKVALQDISFNIQEGVVGVLGPNGAGKTTLMRILTTLFSVQDGEITLNGNDYKKQIKNIRKTLGYLPQNFQVYDTLTGREFLQIIASLKYDSNKEKIISSINEIINKLSMESFVDNKIKSYSGGMRQKLGFAQSIIGNPKLIILDEPTVGLDPEQRNIIRELFPLISDERIVLVTTHIVEDIEYYCNYLIVMNKGRITYKGTKEDFIKKVENLVWESVISVDEYNDLVTKTKIISTIKSKDNVKVKYISRKSLVDNSEIIIPNLQEAYITFNTFYGEESKL